MTDIIRQIASGLLVPFTILYVFFLTSVLLWATRNVKEARMVSIAGLIWFVMITTPFVPVSLVRNLEKQYPPLITYNNNTESEPVYIMILGGGHTINPLLPPNDQLSGRALARLSAGIRLYHHIPNSQLIFSGHARKGNVSHAKALYKTAVLMGIDTTKTHLFENPVNTYSEVIEYVNRFGSDKTVILVTDAIHMPRAMMLFEMKGISPIPAPTNYQIKEFGPVKSFKYRPSARYISFTAIASHEYAGILWAKFRYK